MNNNTKLPAKNMSLSFISLGIDVSSEKLDVFLMNRHEQGVHKVFENNKKGIEKMIHWISMKGFDKTNGKIVMESTGRYHEVVAVMLFTEGFNTYVINPLRIKKYVIANIRKLKTDKYDSRLIAEVALKETYLDKFTLSKDQLNIKKKIAFIRSLEKKTQELKAMMSNYKNSQKDLGNNMSNIEIDVEEMINKIDRSKDKLERDVVNAVFMINNKETESVEYKEAQKAKNILISISGVSPYYAALVYFFYSINLGANAGSWIAYTGLEVSVAESGKWRGAGRLSKRGNRYLRKRNYCAGWGAMMHDKEFKKYYESLKIKGRTHKEALNILGRKIIRVAYSCLKYGNCFDSKVLETLNKENDINKIIEENMCNK